MFEAVLMGELSRQTGEAAGAAPRVSHHPGSPTRIQGSWDDQPKSWGWGRWGGHFSSLVPQLWCPDQNVPSQWAADQRDEGKHRTEAEDRRQKQAAMEQELKGRAWVCGECVCVSVRVHQCAPEMASPVSGLEQRQWGLPLLLKPAISGSNSFQGLGGSCQGRGESVKKCF